MEPETLALLGGSWEGIGARCCEPACVCHIYVCIHVYAYLYTGICVYMYEKERREGLRERGGEEGGRREREKFIRNWTESV
jgi:hypothetical protein